MESQRRHPRTFSFEFFPPKTEEGQAKLRGVRDRLARLGPRFFSVTYGAGGSTRDRTRETVLEVQRESGVDCAPHISCIGASRESIREMLEDYRAEYHERFVQAARDGLSPDAWRNYSAFIAKLDDAIAAQRKVVEQSRARTAEGQQAWLTQRTKLKAFDTLAQRHQQTVARSEARQEQKQSDEHAARRGREDA